MSIAKKIIPAQQSLGPQFNLFLLTWPIFIELFLFMFMGIADTLMISAISDNAVSGIGAANQFMVIAILILEVVGNGASIVVAQYIGARNYKSASKIAALAITLNLVIGLIISIAFVFFHSFMLQALNLQGEVLAYAESYLAIVGGMIFLQAIINALSAIIRVFGFTKQAMLVSLGMNIVHIIGNYVLIFGKFGFPALAVEGAAISSVVSRLLAVIFFVWLLFKILPVKIKWKYFWSLSGEYVRKILKIGIPSAFEQVMYNGCQLIFLYFITFLGDQALAAKNYVSNIASISINVSIAIGMGTSIIVGRLIGAGEKTAAYYRVWKSTILSFGISLLTISLLAIFRYPLMGIFTDDPEIIALGAQVILLSFVLDTGRALNIVLVNSLRASGDAKFPLYIGFFTMVCMSLPLGWYLAITLDLGLAGIWLAIAADEWLRAFIMFLRWRSRKWEKHALVTAQDKRPNYTYEEATM
ncbi:MATE family efflux transporter [Paenibacillus yanchengensis]|uniref:MATE family efflux transporter n=1 Tax=Paenibacillus yanchengensis TaxID=2035833 RepID=A0ABW4YIQ6_9BACL